MKWQGLNSAGHVMTVAVSNAIGDPVYYDSFDSVWKLSLGAQTKGPFAGDLIRLTLTWAMSQTDADAACGSPTGLASVPVTVLAEAIAPGP